MYQLFTSKYDSSNSVIKPASFELIKRTYQREISTIVDYYQNRVFYTSNTHLLVRLLNMFSIPLHYDLDRYTEVAVTRSPYVASHFKFTSDINYGKFHDGIFYGEGNKELIIFSDSYFNPFEVVQDWKSIQAVKVLEHPVSDLSLLIPNGKDNYTDKGLVVIEVNIALLMVQYRCFLRDQLLKMGTEQDSILGTNHFITSYVLPNMLYSHVDIVILNRLANLYYGAPMGKANYKYPFPIIDYTYKLDSVLWDILEHIQNTGNTFESYLKNMPSFFKEDMQESLLMPDIVRTRQVWWALILTRFKAMKLLLDIGNDKGQRRNREYLNKLQLDLKRLMRENIAKVVLPLDMYFDLKMDIEDILKL